MFLAAVIYRTHAKPAAFGFLAVGILFWGPLAGTFLRMAGRTTLWRSGPRIRDMPWVAAHTYDRGTLWSRWAVVDFVLVVAVATLLLTAPR